MQNRTKETEDKKSVNVTGSVTSAQWKKLINRKNRKAEQVVYSDWLMWAVLGGIFLLLIASFGVLGWLHKSNSTLAIRWREMDENTPIAHFHEHKGMAFLHEHPKGNKTHTHTHIGIPIDDYIEYLEYKRDPYRQ